MFAFKNNLIYILILLILVNKSFSIYPLFKDIDKSETNQITSIIVKSKDQYLNYILNYDYVISLIYFGSFEDFSHIINIFDQLSSYKVVNKWKFLKIQCEEPNDICELYEKNDKSIPLIKLYIKSVDQKILNSLIINFEIPQLLEILVKYSTNPLIEIEDDNNITKFYDNYGDFSPLVIYDNQNSEFISCINMLAKKKYFKYFYFGTLSKQNSKEKTEKIIFDNNKIPISMLWDNECDDIDSFLFKNIYPLINKVDTPLIYQLNIIPKILVILISNISNNENIKNFIFNYYKKISYLNRELVFGYIDYNEDKNFANKYNIFIKYSNDINLMIYNYYENIYYIHPITYNIESHNEKELSREINNICSNLSELTFTSGSIIKDLIRKSGLNKIDLSNRNHILIIVFTFITIAGGFYYSFFYEKNKPLKYKSKNE